MNWRRDMPLLGVCVFTLTSLHAGAMRRAIDAMHKVRRSLPRRDEIRPSAAWHAQAALYTTGAAHETGRRFARTTGFLACAMLKFRLFAGPRRK
jgi:hypothetical protein